MLCWYGETQVPPTLAQDLVGGGVREVHIAPDLDHAGLTFATKIRDQLAGTDIRLVTHQLPDELGKGDDIGKAWQQWDDLPDAFRAWLLDLPPVNLPPQRQPHIKQRPPHQTCGPGGRR